MVTNGHPFYVHRARSNLSADEGEWINSDKLQAGDFVRNPNGSWVRILGINRVEGEATVYNFEVEQNHDYFVGSSGILVHNQTECLEIAMNEYNQIGGKVIHMENKIPGRFVDKPNGLYPNTGQWDYHVVHISDKGMVFDKLSKYGNQRIPQAQWWEHFGDDTFNIFRRER